MREKSLKQDELPPALIKILSRDTGNYKIDYVDYTVARTFKHAIDEWYDSLEKEPGSKILRYFQRHSDECPTIFRNLVAIVIAWQLYEITSEHISVSYNLGSIALLFIVGFGVFSVSTSLSFRIGIFFKIALDSYLPISALKLNVGDDACIKRNKRSVVKNIAKMLLGAVASVLLAIASTIVIKHLGI